MPPGAHGLGRQRVVRFRRGGDDQGVAGGEQGLQAKRRAAGFPRHNSGAGRVNVVDAGQDRAPVGCDLERVEPPEVPGASDAYAKLPHAAPVAGTRAAPKGCTRA